MRIVIYCIYHRITQLLSAYGFTPFVMSQSIIVVLLCNSCNTCKIRMCYRTHNMGRRNENICRGKNFYIINNKFC